MLSLLETVLGPLWVWLVINEQPDSNTIIGGTIVVGTLASTCFMADAAGQYGVRILIGEVGH